MIELFNTEESQDIQIVFPSIVAGHDPMGGYRIIKTTDGEISRKHSREIPAPLHAVQYRLEVEVLSNIGDFKPARPMIVKCQCIV
mmetsp:Transcript_13631/g.22898  ORF Transcript_13631/g.22898 Transcript_13631/m.22898 type:complete len:85 (-) Transcript_13631:69-323(-)